MQSTDGPERVAKSHKTIASESKRHSLTNQVHLR